MSCIIVLGNVVEGFAFIGPFDDLTDAALWATTDRRCRDEPWVSAELIEPEKEP